MMVEVFVEGKLKFAYDSELSSIDDDVLKKEVHSFIDYAIDESVTVSVKVIPVKE